MKLKTIINVCRQAPTLCVTLLLSIVISSSATAMENVYLASINPVDENMCPVKLTRAQFLTAMSESRQFRLVNMSNEKLKDLINNLEYIRTLDYDTTTLAQKWEVTDDSILWLKYVDKPVIGIIYIIDRNDITKRVGWFNPEIIWITSDYTIEIGNNEYRISPELKKFLSECQVDVVIPAELISDAIVQPVDD